MTSRNRTAWSYLLVVLLFQFAGWANLVNGHPVEGVVFLAASSWFVVMAAAAFWYSRAPEDFSPRAILYLGDATLVVLSVLALGLVGFEHQLSPSVFPFYLVFVAAVIIRRHRPDARAWNALGLKAAR